MDSPFCNGLGMVALALAQPAGEIRIVPYRFEEASGSPDEELGLTLSKDASTENLGRCILEKLLESRSLNSRVKELQASLRSSAGSVVA